MRWLPFFCVALLFIPASAQRGGHFPKGSSLIKVFLKNGGYYTGILVDADGVGLTVAHLTNFEEVERFSPEVIYRLEVRKVNSVKRNTAIGAGIGFLTGFAIGWEEYKTGSGADINQVGHAAGSGLLGAFAGGFIGFITGTFTKGFYVMGSSDQYGTILPKLLKYKPPALDED
jgi:hypothetical protein